MKTHPQSFRSSRSGMGLRICVSDKFPGFLMLQFWGPDFENIGLGKADVVVVVEVGSLRQRRGGRYREEPEAAVQVRAGGPRRGCRREGGTLVGRRWKGTLGREPGDLLYNPRSAMCSFGGLASLFIVLKSQFSQLKMGIVVLAKKVYNTVRIK